jgi:hypothetical protein
MSTITGPTTGLLYQPRTMDDGECKAISGILGRGNGNTRRKHALVTISPPQIPYDLTRTAAVGSVLFSGFASCCA